MTNPESYISVRNQRKGKERISVQDSSEVTTTDVDSDAAENALVKNTRRIYTRQQYIRRLRVGVRLILASGRPNLFFEEN
jgi:hypothetical protein